MRLPTKELIFVLLSITLRKYCGLTSVYARMCVCVCACDSRVIKRHLTVKEITTAMTTSHIYVMTASWNVHLSQYRCPYHIS